MKSVIVNGELLLQAEIRSFSAALRQEREAAQGPLSLEARLALQDESLHLLIDRLLLFQEARRLALAPAEFEIDAVLAQSAKRFDGISGCRAGADTAESREEIRRRLMIDSVLQHWRDRAPRPRLSEAKDYYRMNQQQFYTPEMIHASHIVRHFDGDASEDSVHTQVENLRKRVSAGEDFGQIAASHSDCPENNGDLGWFQRGVMVEEFDDVVFTAPIGELTPVFKSMFGFHFALVHARRSAGVPQFNEVLPVIQNSLWLSKQDREVGQALDELRAKASIGSHG